MYLNKRCINIRVENIIEFISSVKQFCIYESKEYPWLECLLMVVNSFFFLRRLYDTIHRPLVLCHKMFIKSESF